MDQTVAMNALLGESSVSGARASIKHLDRSQWEYVVRNFLDFNYRQTWPYSEALAKKRGAASEHVAVQSGGDVLALANVRIKALPVIGGGLAYISGGPLVRKSHGPDNDLERLEICLEALDREYVQRRGLALRIAVPIDLSERNHAIAQRFERAGFRACDGSGQYRTVLIDLDRPLERMRSSFHSHWRRNLNTAERNGLDVSFGTELCRFEQVGHMLEALQVRKGFTADLNANFFADIQEKLSAQDRLIVGLAQQNNAPLAGSIIAVHGDVAVYLAGASTDLGRELRASYILHWRTIEVLQTRGSRWYDLGGIDLSANPGVSSFKLRTNGLDVTAAGPFLKSPEGARARIASWAERAYLWARRMQSR
ncbi:aminoacyltransferase [Sinorhizobium garamanticum]|uniref:Aminoacyltransferase n=1 Tax=Sinorhizobium garamanticum TaxID=680247 RepID=A0ABY8DLR5_9HYPH|nr:peptidoglycan bridge formation glycyltransferase FemA/FemB family protein [Sinorhizobium garamanticum]WEX91237.1 aminoacyltransferase [Sinorhizobium garamanticum]